MVLVRDFNLPSSNVDGGRSPYYQWSLAWSDAFGIASRGLTLRGLTIYAFLDFSSSATSSPTSSRYFVQWAPRDAIAMRRTRS